MASLQRGGGGVLGLMAGAGNEGATMASPLSGDLRGTTTGGPYGSSTLESNAAVVSSMYPPGSATLRVMEYCDALSGKGSLNESEIHNVTYWKSLTQEYYVTDGVYRQVCWNPSAREQRTFELPTPVIPRYLHTVHLSGVVGHSTVLSRPREWSLDRLSSVPTPPTAKGAVLGLPDGRTTHFVQVDKAKVHVEYENGWLVVHTGILRAALTPIGHSLKFQFVDFISTHLASYVPRVKIARGLVEQVVVEDVVRKIRGKQDVKKEEGSRRERDDEKFTMPVERWSMPENPVNEYGMTLRAMRCLEITESVCQLRDLMDYGLKNQYGPMEALRNLAEEFRQAQAASGGAETIDLTGTAAKHKPFPRGDMQHQGGETNAMKRKDGVSHHAGGGVKTEDGDDRRQSSSPHKRMR